MADVLEEVVTKYLDAKIQGIHIRNQGGANMVYNHGRNTAKSLGLSQDGITPFPAPTTVTVNTEAEAKPQEKSNFSKLAPYLLAGASLLGGGGLGAAGMSIASQWSQKPQVQQQAPQDAPDKPSDPSRGNVGIKVE